MNLLSSQAKGGTGRVNSRVAAADHSNLLSHLWMLTHVNSLQKRNG
jgi:hypothetical protein